MEEKTPNGIEEIVPRTGQQLIEYMRKIKESNRPHNYYTQYAVEYLENVKTNCYIENRVNFLTIEYDVPCEDGTTRTEKLIIAKNEDKMGNFSDIKDILDKFFKAVQKYATRKLVKPENYVAALKKLGWTFTNEGLDLIQTTKSDGVQQIRKTEFVESEFEELSQEEINRNQKAHVHQREKELISMLEDYIVKSYTGLPQDIPDELKEYKKKVEQYVEAKSSKDGKSNDLLSYMFKEMTPIEEKTSMNALMQESFNHNMQTYIDLIPERLRDYETHTFLKKYMNIREQAIHEREEGILPENSNSQYQLASLVRTIDKHKEKNAQENRDDITNAVDKMITKSDRKVSGNER